MGAKPVLIVNARTNRGSTFSETQKFEKKGKERRRRRTKNEDRDSNAASGAIQKEDSRLLYFEAKGNDTRQTNMESKFDRGSDNHTLERERIRGQQEARPSLCSDLCL